METCILEPEAFKLIESMRDIGYTLDTALADIIDNSISAGASTVQILANTAGEHPCIAIHDDGHGMSRDELLSAMRPGSRNPLADFRVHDLGRFGTWPQDGVFLPMSKAFCPDAQGRNNDLRDMGSGSRGERQPLGSLPTVQLFGNSLRRSIRPPPGTLVVWEKLDRIRGEKNTGSITLQLDTAREHLELVFHRFLAGENGQPKIKMLLNGRPLHPFDPFNSSNN